MRPSEQTQVQLRSLELQVFDLVVAELDCWRQRSGQDAVWSWHHESRVLFGTLVGWMVWDVEKPTTARKSEMEAKVRILADVYYV